MAKYEALLLDFDGTMFRLFVNYDLHALSARMSDALGELGIVFDAALDPFEAFGLMDKIADARVRAQALELADAAVLSAELEALECGVPLAYCDEVLRELVQAGVRVGVATNNSARCVRIWLERHLGEAAAHKVCVFGREALHPEHLKPNPWMIVQAARVLGADPHACLYVGDTMRDYEAASACGCAFVGMAHSEEKRQKLLAFIGNEYIVCDYWELKQWVFGTRGA